MLPAGSFTHKLQKMTTCERNHNQRWSFLLHEHGTEHKAVCVCVCVIGPSAQQSDTSLPTQVMAHFPRMNDDHHLMRILHFIALDLPVTEQPPARLHTDESADPLLN